METSSASSESVPLEESPPKKEVLINEKEMKASKKSKKSKKSSKKPKKSAPAPSPDDEFTEYVSDDDSEVLVPSIEEEVDDEEALVEIEKETVKPSSKKNKKKDKKKDKKKNKKNKNGKKGKKVDFKGSKRSQMSLEDQMDPAKNPSLAARRRQVFLQKAVDLDHVEMVPDDEKVLLEFSNITFKVPAEKKYFQRCRGVGDMKTILDGVTGYVAPGEMVAIVGPSGAGKTSLLNVLSGRIKMGTKPAKVLTGKITLNGDKATSAMYNRYSGFVAQEDVLMGSSTARECLQFAADMTLGDKVPEDERKKRVKELMDLMALDKCKDNFVGYTGQASQNSGILRGLSGGERKRLSVCHELIHNPRFLFLDEPTSGLDSFAAQTVIQSLQRLAFQGRTILCTIHQPSTAIFNLFDKVMVLADGKVCYFGPPNTCLPYFQSIGYKPPAHVNPADYMLKIVQVATDKDGAGDEEMGLNDLDKNQVNLLLDEYKESKFAQDAKNPPPPPSTKLNVSKKRGYEVGYLNQFVLLTIRSWLGVVREPMLFKARAFQSLFMGVLAGLIWLRLGFTVTDLSDRISGAFFVIISAMFGGINGPTYVFPNERSVYFREKAAGMYSSSLYFISKVITQLPINVLAPTLLITPAYWMMRLNDGFPEFLILLLTAMLVSNVGFGLGMALSTAILDVSVVQKLQSLVTLPFMLFGGLFLNSANVPDYVLWLEYLSFIKYAFRITINTILEGDSYFCRQGDLRDVPYVPAGFSAPLRAADNATVANFNGNSGFISVCPITSGDTMLKTLSLSYSENNFTWYWDFLILVLMNIVFLFISWAFLKYRSPKS